MNDLATRITHRIMNIRPKKRREQFDDGAEWLAYREGLRDARHKACDIASEEMGPVLAVVEAAMELDADCARLERGEGIGDAHAITRLREALTALDTPGGRED